MAAALWLFGLHNFATGHLLLTKNVASRPHWREINECWEYLMSFGWSDTRAFAAKIELPPKCRAKSSGSLLIAIR